MLLQRLKISGHSMEPSIKDGAEVLASSIPFIFFKPKVGNVVAFKYFNKILIKRIKKSQSNHFLMEGDNVSDSLKLGWVNKNDIIGKVIYKL
ncbi:MAG TPA: S26 family signal peptidase [Patescibacteria group bacterium]|nr:S26 family signal peptidase [Patescibacteria group bacterium]